MVRYKQQLGLSANADSVAPFPDDKRVVIVKQLTLVVPDREDKVLDLTMPLEEIKNKVSSGSQWYALGYSHVAVYINMSNCLPEIRAQRRLQVQNKDRLLRST